MARTRRMRLVFDDFGLDEEELAKTIANIGKNNNLRTERQIDDYIADVFSEANCPGLGNKPRNFLSKIMRAMIGKDGPVDGENAR